MGHNNVTGAASTELYLKTDMWRVTYSISPILPPQTRNVTHLHEHPFQVSNDDSCQDRLRRENEGCVIQGKGSHVLISNLPFFP